MLDRPAEDDTIKLLCPLCAARARVDAALVRSGVEVLTVVVTYARARFGGAVENAKALVCFVGGRTVRGDGHSREESIVNALEQGGMSL